MKYLLFLSLLLLAACETNPPLSCEQACEQMSSQVVECNIHYGLGHDDYCICRSPAGNIYHLERVDTELGTFNVVCR